MIIKSFTADTVSGALKLIREEMGGGAVILKTRPCNPAETALTGNRVEVTACVDEKGLSPKGPSRDAKPTTTALRYFAEDTKPEQVATKIPRKRSDTGTKRTDLMITKNVHDFAAKLEKKLDFILDSQYSPESSVDFSTRITPIYLNLLDDDIPTEVASHLTKAVEQKVTPDCDIEAAAYDVLVEELSSAISQEISIKPGMKIVFAGPSGAGKTSALAKLAAQLASEDKMKVTLASLDNMKVAAYEEIGSYAEMLDLPLDLSGNFKKKSNKDSVLIIDTPSLPCDDSRGAELVKRIVRLEPDIIFLVYSACSRSRDLIDSIVHFESLRPTYLIASHLDETKRWGAVMTMAKYLEVPLAYTTSSIGAVGTLDKPDPNLIARRLLRVSEVSHVE